MKLRDCNPRWAEVDGERTAIIIDCPKCGTHLVSIQLSHLRDHEGKHVFDARGDLDTMTIESKTAAHVAQPRCGGNFTIRGGDIIFV